MITGRVAADVPLSDRLTGAALTADPIQASSERPSARLLVLRPSLIEHLLAHVELRLAHCLAATSAGRLFESGPQHR